MTNIIYVSAPPPVSNLVIGGDSPDTTLVVTESGSVVDTIISSGGYEVLQGGGRDSGTTVSSGGWEAVSSSGTASATTVGQYGDQIVSGSGATAADATVNKGGYQILSAGGIAIGTNDRGEQWVRPGGTANGTTVASGGMQPVLSGGQASGTTVDQYGEQVVSGSGAVTFQGGGTLQWDGATFTPDRIGGVSGFTAEAVERAVETLTAGDLVVTTMGEARPVAWLGRQTVSRRFADPLRIMPIRITAGALNENVPARDLRLSPDHALFIDGVLIQAGGW